MRVCILQSNYIPWKGYFDLIDASDLCILYDTRQYTKHDWRNRNKVIVGGDAIWLTIPVKSGGRLGQRICDTEVASRGWTAKHWRTIEQAYARRPEFERFKERWAEEWRALESESLLSRINERLIRCMMADLGTTTELRWDHEVETIQPFLEDDGRHPSSVVAGICSAVGATEYLTGPAGLGYLREADFRDLGIELVVADYATYPAYPQATEVFNHSVSIVDLLANVGARAREFLVGQQW